MTATFADPVQPQGQPDDFSHAGVALVALDGPPSNSAGAVITTELRARFGVAEPIDADESSSASTLSVTSGKG